MVPPDDRAVRGGERLALGVVLALALALRLREAMRVPLWYDELYSLAAVSRPLPDVLRVARADVHPPLHFVLAWAWSSFAHSDLAIRSLSIACGLAGLVAAWALTRTLFGRLAALLATTLLAIHPWHVYGSQEARPYALLWLLLTLSALGAWRWREHAHGRDGVLFVAASALALWTHYLAGAALLGQFLWGAIVLRREPRRLGAWVGLHVAVAALFAPDFPTLAVQMHRPVGAILGRRPGAADLLDAFRRLSFSAVYLVPVALGLAALAFRGARHRRAAAFAFAVGPGTLLLTWIAGVAGLRVFGPKYALFALPSLYSLVAAGTLGLPARALRAGVAAALVLLGARSLAVWRPNPEAEAFARVRAIFARELEPGDVIVHADTHTWLFGERYAPRARNVLLLMGRPIPFYEGAAIVPDSVRTDSSTVRELRDAGARWWAMSARPAGFDDRPAGLLFDAIAPAPRESLGVVILWRGRPR